MAAKNVDDSDHVFFCAVAQQPVSVGINANSPEFKQYSSGVFDACANSGHGHAVLIVGYNSTADGEDYWIVKNSWGTDWGIEGYIYIRRDPTLENGTCAINALASYPTKLGLQHAS
ncbi:Vignain [Morella rubra]|uniref:Vignain n=1 Tax=Morella rubra TaxID=262757 RepID=A0A6A1VCH7_9ROSI|nr:Vignain [Morella rubra]